MSDPTDHQDHSVPSGPDRAPDPERGTSDPTGPHRNAPGGDVAPDHGTGAVPPAAAPGRDPATSPVEELEVSLGAFLPEGVTLEPTRPGPDDAPTRGSERDEAGAAAGAGHEAEGPADHGDEPDVRPDGGDEPGEREVPPAPDASDDAVDTELLDAVEQDLAAVDAALTAIDDGSYGTCAACGRPIAADLLASDPVRRTCSDH